MSYGKVNINTADRDELNTLGDVDLGKADTIIKYRETIRNYETVEELSNYIKLDEY